jgi:hypothetical protein
MARGHHVGRAEGRRLREEHDYFLGRARNYVNMFDPATGFFQGRKTDGSFLSPPEAFDPREWGHQHDYTETDGWGFAFHAPQDGQGLANLYGGRAGLAAKLDAFFSMPETAKNVGSYGGTIHEMIEARDVRMGQWGFSNQVSHHIPYMYDYAGQPYKTQAKVREALRRMYLGSEIGQGYAGDEDNGETSAWYLFGALGFYPLQVGSPYYAIGSPLFRKATLHLENGRDLVVRARHNSQENVYVQGLTLNGRRIDRAYLAHRELARGGVLTFEMGPRPSRWATGRHAAPPSITHGDQAPLPLRDATGDDRGTATGSADVAALFDDTSGTRATLAGARPWVQYRFNHDERQAIRFYTLTSGDGPASADPRSWVVKGSNDGQHWKVLDARRGETFRWRSQTRPFELHHARDYAHYRIELGGATTLAEVELLTTRRYVPPTLSASLDAGTATAGSTVPVRVSVENTGTAPDSGDVVLTGPQGWGIAPATAHFGPVAPGASATVTFQLSVPADAAPGSFPLTAAVNSPLAEVHARRRAGDRRHDRVHAGHRGGGAVAARRRRLPARRRRVRRARALRRRWEPLRLPLRAAGCGDGGHAHARRRQRVPRPGLHRREELAHRARAAGARARSGQPRGAPARPQRAARRRAHGLRPRGRQPPARRLGRLAGPREAGAADRLADATAPAGAEDLDLLGRLAAVVVEPLHLARDGLGDQARRGVAVGAPRELDRADLRDRGVGLLVQERGVVADPAAPRDGVGGRGSDREHAEDDEREQGLEQHGAQLIARATSDQAPP